MPNKESDAYQRVSAIWHHKCLNVRFDQVALKGLSMSLPASAPVVFTVGHSSRALVEVLELLTAHQITTVVDVRKMPGSRAHPQFNSAELSQSLRDSGIGYLHLPGLGGLRRPRRDSPNGAWRNSSFKGYADYMQTPEFAEEMEKLVALARVDRLALMCAEAVPWRCHRSLIADALVVRGVRVRDIMSVSRCPDHELRPWAHVNGTDITYPVPEEAAHHEVPEAGQ